MLRQRKEHPRSDKRDSFSPRQHREPEHEIVLRLPMERPSYVSPSEDSSAAQPNAAQPKIARGSVDVDFYI